MNIADLTYTIRYSKRAKYISMSIRPDRGLEIVLPKGYNEADGLRFLKKNKTWLLKHADMLEPVCIAQQQKRFDLIKEIDLRCIEKTFMLRYLQIPSQSVRVRMPLDDVLIISGDIKDARCCQPHLDAWLKQMGQMHLISFLKEVSDETGLVYRSASIRLQRARWGSCSAKGDISLNARLLYHPRDVVRYVLIHELCHLKELNHSSRFWALVRRFEPRYKELKRRLATL